MWTCLDGVGAKWQINDFWGEKNWKTIVSAMLCFIICICIYTVLKRGKEWERM